PPSVRLSPVPPSLSGRVTLQADVDDGNGSGVALVRFEWATPDSSVWTPIGVDGTPPYTPIWDTRQRPNRSYVLGAPAIDLATRLAHNESPDTSAPLGITHPVHPPAPLPPLQTLAAPARGPSLLGAVGASAQREAWASGFAGAAPAEVAGERLPYPALGDQLV